VVTYRDSRFPFNRLAMSGQAESEPGKVSPELGAPVPAALSHGPRGVGRRRT